MVLQTHDETGYRWSEWFQPWEVHPALVHLPIAFLLGGIALDLYAWARCLPGLARVATGLLVAGVLTGVLTALAGVLAFYTVPAHTEEAHRLMYWHAGIQAGALLLFAWPTWRRWRARESDPATAGRLIACIAAVLLFIGSAVGGYIVYHGGAGVDPELLKPELRHSH